MANEQAINQCAGFLRGLSGVNVVAVANTAVAAEMVNSEKRRGKTRTAQAKELLYR